MKPKKKSPLAGGLSRKTPELDNPGGPIVAETINLSKPTASDWHILSRKFIVQFTLRGDRLEAEWRPRKPAAHEIPKLLKKYRAARDAFLESMVEHTGTAAVLDFLP